AKVEAPIRTAMNMAYSFFMCLIFTKSKDLEP
ncbi:MAG: hypothetical protein ACI9A8_000001, partial [Cryomorphaceae bacterium]